MGGVLHASVAGRERRSSVRCRLPHLHHRRRSRARRVNVEEGPRIEVPGVDVGPDWLTLELSALGLGTLRAGISGANR